jgi:hypothetical protein
MAESLELLIPPPCSSGRKIYPLVSVTAHSWESGGLLYAEPVALIIAEEEQWYFVSLKEGITQECILMISQK